MDKGKKTKVKNLAICLRNFVIFRISGNKNINPQMALGQPKQGGLKCSLMAYFLLMVIRL
jgi:hypothetical protein